MKFDLHPWELKLTAPWELKLNPLECEGEVDFELEVEGEICQIRHVRRFSSWCPYFRFHDAPEEHFMLADFNVTDPRLRSQPFSYFGDNFSQVIRKSFQRAFELHTWGRYFWLRADLNRVQNISEHFEAVWNIFLLANGQGTLVGKSVSWNSTIPFKWHQGPSPEILRARTNSQWIEWLQKEMEKPESAVRFAHELAGLSGDEANLRFTVWQHGNLQQWEDVMRLILQSQTSSQRNSSESQAIYWGWPLNKKRPGEQEKQGELSHLGADEIWYDSDLRDTCLLQRLQIASRYFAPDLDEELIEHRLGVKYNRPLIPIGVTIIAPTAHERLEAALNLRSWAQGKFSPEETELICRPDNI